MNSNFEVCIMIWQSATYSNSDWSIIASSWTTLYDSPDYYNVELGPGMQGTVNDIYMNYQYLKMPSVFIQNGDNRLTQRTTWFDSIYEYQPYCIGLPGWGNGIFNSTFDNTPGEACDDGNLKDGDGWSSTCTVEYKWYWFQFTGRYISFWSRWWGNGLLESSLGEEWDDKNGSSNDGWSSTWIKEVGYTFSGGEDQLTVATPICGDVMRVTNEACDDNDINDGKGCKSDWSGSLQGWYCSSTSPSPSVCNFVLMDGVRAINGEECDDGNSIDNDGCSNSGTITPGYR